MSVSYGGDSITFADGSVQSGGWTGFKNRIINGAMVIDQRNAGASFTPTTTSSRTYGTCDRWGTYITVASKFTIQQNAGSVTPPAGYSNYLGITSTSAYSVTSTDLNLLQQPIEGFNFVDFNFGTASAQSVTLSFWVRSSLTGTFGGSLVNYSANRSYPFTYTISVANTWQQITITIPGDTTGTWVGATNGVGAYLNFNIACGSTNIAASGAWTTSTGWSATSATNITATNGATWYITGVQLERGSTASSFEYRPYGTELALCQRYCFRATLYDLGQAQNATYTYYPVVRLPVTMRASASYTASSGTFTPNTGNAGVPALNFSSADTILFYNISANWTTTAFIQVSATITAEL